MKKQTKKKTARVKIDRKIKKEIRAAVEQLPNLILERTKTDYPTEPAERADRKTDYLQRETSRPAAQRKKTLLWAGVIFFTLVIFALWIWNSKLLIQTSPASRTITR